MQNGNRIKKCHSEFISESIKSHFFKGGFRGFPFYLIIIRIIGFVEFENYLFKIY